jgi:hypothetical protein
LAVLALLLLSDLLSGEGVEAGRVYSLHIILARQLRQEEPHGFTVICLKFQARPWPP